MFRLRHLFSLTALAVALACGAPAPAQTIIDEWSSIKVPPPPELKPVTLEPKTTALLAMDMIKQFCNMELRPRCVASIPRIEKLLAEARAKGVTIIYTLLPSANPNGAARVLVYPLPGDTRKANPPAPGAPGPKSMLVAPGAGRANAPKDKGFRSAITGGTPARGAALAV